MSTRDWADDEADVIASTVATVIDNATARSWIAAKLRLIRHQGKIEGFDEAERAVNETFAAKWRRATTKIEPAPVLALVCSGFAVAIVAALVGIKLWVSA